MSPSASRNPDRALVVGASGAIGSALARELVRRGVRVTGLSRSGDEPHGPRGRSIDLTSEGSIEAAAASLRDQAPFDLIVVATGILRDGSAVPERRLAELNAENLLHLFAVNAVGPGLIAKHFVPLLPRNGRSVFAALSARVGSISDNRLGGWYGYRASKSALNMIIKTLSIELSRTHPDAICVSLHPGTVDTPLSKPFQKSVSPDRLFTPEQSASHLLDVIDQLTCSESGRCFAWDGAEIRS